jgi:hypothetical protein
MNSKSSDFIQVGLSAAGVTFAGADGVVRIANGRLDYEFKSGAPVRVLTSEWDRVLSTRRYNGNPIFEVVEPLAAPSKPAAPAPPSAASAAPVAQTTSAATNAAKAEVK